MSQAPLQRDLVLVGGGHAHALALRMLAMSPLGGLRITLVSPDSHTPYSGMLPGLVAGHYEFTDAHIDLARLCQWAGVRFIQGEVTGLDVERQRISFAQRPPLAYDLLSLDIGSNPELDSVPGARDHAVPVKPVSRLWRRWQRVQHSIEVGQGDTLQVCVVGGGAGSVELVLAMAWQCREQVVKFSLVCGAPEILAGYNGGARRAALAALAHHGVALKTSARVARVDAQRVHLASGEALPFDELFWCTGAAPAPWIAASGLPTDEQGFLAVRDTLQVRGYDNVFAAGDIATQVNHPRPKAGVFAVRQGPVLAGNIRAAALGKPLRAYQPQRRFLSLLSLGDRRAAADKGLFSARGAWVWRWKDRIDRQFMARFSALPAMTASTGQALPELADPAQQQDPCGGCGAKVGADSLSRALASLAARYPEHCAGSEARDTSPVPLSGQQAVVQSLDVLRQMVGDHWLMGRIAANHALSDLYASGARPVSALATVTLPFATASLQERDLEQLLDGALHELSDVDCQLTGGHSLQGAELSLGFVVNGVPLSSDGSLLEKGGLRDGDDLVLTKALGTGVLFAAHMQLAVDGRDIATAVEAMLLGNGRAAQLAVQLGASACTDVTGFGLLGHLREMLGDDCSAEIEASAVPALPGAAAALAAGYRSTMHEANQQAVAALLTDEVESTTALLLDPQTSGGLLIGIAPQHSGALVAALRENGCGAAAVIGKIRRDRSGPNTLTLK